MRLGGSVGPELFRLERETTALRDVPCATTCPRESTETYPLAHQIRRAAGGIVSRMACNSVVISRASISIKPEPCIAMVLRGLAILCSVTKLPASSLAPPDGHWVRVIEGQEVKPLAQNKHSVPNSPPPTTTGLLWFPSKRPSAPFLNGPIRREKRLAEFEKFPQRSRKFLAITKVNRNRNFSSDLGESLLAEAPSATAMNTPQTRDM